MKINRKTRQEKTNLTLISNPALKTLLASFSAKETLYSQMIRQVKILYTCLLLGAMKVFFPTKKGKVKTRMNEFLSDHFLDKNTPVICVDLVRAGMLPTQTCFETLLEILPSSKLRQDHLFLNRATDENGKVVGVHFTGAKIGGDKKGAIVIFADPMGATGVSLSAALDYYKKHVFGIAKRFVVLNLMVSPDYVKNLSNAHPDLQIFALRMDRKLSSRQYILPGAGGVGELLNNDQT